MSDPIHIRYNNLTGARSRIMRIFFIIFFIFVCVVPVYAQSTNPVSIHGFISQGYLQSNTYDYWAETKDGTFQFNEMGINFNAKPKPRLRIGLQLFARDFGNFGNDEIIIDWGYASYRFSNELGIQAGIIKMPHGLYNDTRDIDMVRTSILLPASVYNEAWRDSFLNTKGAGIYGELPFGFSYQAQYGTMDMDTEGGVVNDFERSLSKDISKGISGMIPGFHLDVEMQDITVDYKYAASLQWAGPFVEGLKFGATMAGVQMDARADICEIHFNSLKTYVYSAEYLAENLKLTFEYSKTDIDFTIPSFSVPVPQAGISVPIPEIRSGGRKTANNDEDGFYVSAAYRFLDKLEIGAYYSEYYPRRHDRDGDRYSGTDTPDYKAWLKDTALSFRFDPNMYWVVKLEAHLMNGIGTSGIHMEEVPVHELEEDWYLFGAKISYIF